jgi:hypothetical protein
MSVSLSLRNQTHSDVYFGFYSAPEDNLASARVMHMNPEPTKLTLDHADARIISVWTDQNDLYKTNDEPLLLGYTFENNKSYTVTLTPDQINVKFG